MNKNGFIIIIVVVVVLVILGIVAGCMRGRNRRRRVEREGYAKHEKKYIITIKNPIDGTDMLWINNEFTKNNWPGPHFQVEQKKESLKYILERGRGVLDIGAHIGDYSIPLALALKNKSREDIIVYAIDPSPDKCNFMKEVTKLNGLNNIKVICKGVSDKIGKYSISNISDGASADSGAPDGEYNSGWSEWKPDKNGMLFTTLDKLYKEGEIGEIGFFWLDAELMEPLILRGGREYLTTFKPYILMEYHSHKFDDTSLEDNKTFINIFEECGIKISDKQNNFDDILLEFIN